MVNDPLLQKNILLVEDDPRLSSLIQTFLRSEGFAVSHCDRGNEVQALVLATLPDLIILDLMLPGLDGIAVCQQLRPSYTGPILMITAQDDDLTEASALNLGIDDFMTKPLRPHVLLARINALWRRSSAPVVETASPLQRLAVQDIQLDGVNRQVYQQQQLLEFTDAEFDLLQVLMQHAGQILSRERLFQAVRGIEYDGLDRSLDQRISTLRKKLDDSLPPHRYIKSVRSKGYLFLAN
ncbi:two-component system, OmpR family, response regulator RstA [Pseudomonas anguilliseptica]|uniref:Two-component system, OmpR family, response regulator RstA n=1 Tax=Pseudomonas anguilliseptica TaxID=53406 RepID=A0A1H4ZSN7_PSEAG|nr:two-component system, OmpR family, response regulator RstA [Pseudomonas anguilliseptica]